MTIESMLEILERCRLCRQMRKEEIQILLEDHHSNVKTYQKGEIIFHEEDVPEKIFVLLSGSVLIARDAFAGRRMVLTQVEQPGEMFGEIYAFIEQPSYDMYTEAMEKSVILSLDHTIFESLSGNDVAKMTLSDSKLYMIQKLRNNMLAIFANKAFQMNKKLRILGNSGLREKIVHYLYQYLDDKENVTGKHSREEMADYLNVTRPSLSRELGNMQKEGIISLQKRKIVVLDREAFEQYL
ncbi:MAG: Crp/Fnr family transcriptional regulator [Lachnospiraceae bacterium]|nr:Crp/Fnr family transcriptional regulator [Lachnospiraceae bacterium]